VTLDHPERHGLVDPSTGIWHLEDFSSFYYGNPGDLPMMGDWDCDSVDTPGLYRQSDGYVYLRNSNTQGVADIRFFFGNPGDVPLPGDFDGDGCDTVSLYRPSEATVYVINRLGGGDAGLGIAEQSFRFGDSGDEPFPGDFDGDGDDEIGAYRSRTGLIYLRLELAAGAADQTLYFGRPGDRFLAGDWNGAGCWEEGGCPGVGDTVALWRPSERRFYVRYSNTTGPGYDLPVWGERDWLPVSGRFVRDPADVLRDQMVGEWSGLASTQWVESYAVAIEFRDDGSYTASSSGPYPPFYWFPVAGDTLTTWRIDWVDELDGGWGSLAFDRFGTPEWASLMNVVVDDRLTFDVYWAGGRLSYDLVRTG
jgi:hypothetical protein